MAPKFALSVFLALSSYTRNLPRLFDCELKPQVSWTDLPTPSSTLGTDGTATAIPTCDQDVSVDCYGYTQTWTVVASHTSTVSESATTSTTVLAVQASGDAKPLWPPPPVTVAVNQRVRIELVNNIGDTAGAEKVTLHFHGILQENGYGTMDGPTGITQCALSQDSEKNKFIYDFKASRPGTYWIHSHDPGQYPKGLRSLFIVTDDANDKAAMYDYVEDYVVTIADWFNDFSSAESRYISSGRDRKPCGWGVELMPDGITVNDDLPLADKTRARYAGKDYFIKPGKWHRFRLINMSAYTQLFVQFEEHPVIVVEIDGIAVEFDETKTTDGVVLTSGQRISVLLYGQDAGKGAHRILVAIDPKIVPRGASPDCGFSVQNQSTVAWACFTYEQGKTCEEQTKPDWTKYTVSSRPRLNGRLKVPWQSTSHTTLAYPWNYNEMALTPKHSTYTKKELMNVQPKGIYWLNLIEHEAENPKKPDGHRGFGSFNNELWGFKDGDLIPNQPGLVQALSRFPPGGYPTAIKAQNPGEAIFLPKGYPNAIMARNLGEAIWLVFNGTQGDHPMHLHGHHFSVLYKGLEDPASLNAYKAAIDSFNNGAEDTTDFDLLRAAIDNQAPEKPVMRDTMMAEKYQLMIAAFVVDNPGVWAMHCHNDFHARTGMMMQVVEAPDILQERLGNWHGLTNVCFNYATGTDSWNTDQVVKDSWARNVIQCLNP